MQVTPLSALLAAEAPADDRGLNPTIDEILAKWQPKFPDLTGKALVAEALAGAEDEREEHGEGCDPDRTARQHLFLVSPVYYSGILWPALRAAGVAEDEEMD